MLPKNVVLSFKMVVFLSSNVGVEMLNGVRHNRIWKNFQLQNVSFFKFFYPQTIHCINLLQKVQCACAIGISPVINTAARYTLSLVEVSSVALRTVVER